MLKLKRVSVAFSSGEGLGERWRATCPGETSKPPGKSATWFGDYAPSIATTRCFHGTNAPFGRGTAAGKSRCYLLQSWDRRHNAVIRYAVLVKRIASHVAVAASPALLPLLETAPGINRLIALKHPGKPVYHNAQVEVEIMELPYTFRTTLNTIPNAVPYLKIARPAPSPGKRLKIGLVWAAGDWDCRRSVPFRWIRELGRVRNIDWLILQRGPSQDWKNEFGMNAGSDNLLATAQTMSVLDVLITVDSMPAHLAGARVTNMDLAPQ